MTGGELGRTQRVKGDCGAPEAGEDWGTPGVEGATPAGGRRPGDECRREKGCGYRQDWAVPTVPPNPASRLAAPRPREGAEPLRPPQPVRAGTRPLSLRVPGWWWEGRASWGWVCSPAQAPTRNAALQAGGWADDPAARDGGWRGRWLRAEEKPQHRPQLPGRIPGAPLLAGIVAPALGLPSLLLPPSPALPRATAPTAGGAKRTYLEPDKPEPLGLRSQSPPRVTGAATANRSHCHEPLQPIPLHSGLRAPSRPQPMGKSGRRAQPPGPQSPPPLPPRRRGAADWPGPRRGRTWALGWVGARLARAAGPGSGGVELQPPPSGLAHQPGWSPEVCAFVPLSPPR